MKLYTLLSFLERSIVSGRGCPSVREIKDELELKSTREVKEALDKLVELGYIRRTTAKQRNLVLGRLPSKVEARQLLEMEHGPIKSPQEEEGSTWSPWKG